MSAKHLNRQWLLARRPVGALQPQDFKYNEVPIQRPVAGEVLVRTLYFGYDASQRIWLTDNGGYMPPVQVGEPIRCVGIGQVVESQDPAYKKGDLVEGFMSWQDFVLARSDGPMPLRVLSKGNYPLSWNLSVFGVSGLTAYFAVTDVLKVTAGDTVVISAATGATGSLAGGIAKILGAKQVIGLAGGKDKCRWIVEKAGYDVAIDYKSEDVGKRLAELCPQGVDVYFDNVGGEILDTLFLHMAPRGRILICGAIASGYVDTKVPGPQNYMRICTHMLTVSGILLFFYRDQIAQGAMQLANWVREGKLQIEEKIFEGFEKAPALLPTMFTGKDPGKMLLKIADPE
jgi:NADPH-dependent curcumin reductase